MPDTYGADHRWADRVDAVGATLVGLTLLLAPLAFDRGSAEVFALPKLTVPFTASWS